MYLRLCLGWRTALHVAALTVGINEATPAQVATQTGADSRPTSDSNAVRELLATFAKAISAPAGAAPDWATFRSLFVPGARIESVVADSSGGLTWRSQTVDEFITAATPGMHRSGFEENVLGTRIHIYGAIAHVWSGYEVRRGSGGAPRRIRGVNSYQLVRQDGRWRVVELLWTNERAAGPLPAEWAASAGH
jgi:SnoaL-like domain